MVAISCSGKFHAFNLAEQLERQGQLSALHTTYAWSKNTFMRRFAGRTDKEIVPVGKIRTAVPLAVLMKLRPQASPVWNEAFDRLVAGRLRESDGIKVFIGWSGMSLHSIRKAKSLGKITVVERGSAHIGLQDQILRDEYKRFGLDFQIDPRTVDKEMKEYEAADYISIPSTFSRNSFLARGVADGKLIVNPYGSSGFFKPAKTAEPAGKFRVLYVGSLSIRKGLIYLFQALNSLRIPPERLEAWFVGKVEDEMKPVVERYAQPNWTFFGHVNHYDLPNLISGCQVAVQPSLEDGFGMVILQMMSCGVPVIATMNTGGPDVITDGENGFLVPIRDPGAIAANIERLYADRPLLQELSRKAAAIGGQGWTWEQYGERYAGWLRRITA